MKFKSRHGGRGQPFDVEESFRHSDFLRHWVFRHFVPASMRKFPGPSSWNVVMCDARERVVAVEAGRCAGGDYGNVLPLPLPVPVLLAVLLASVTLFVVLR